MHRRRLVGRKLDPYAKVLLERQQVVDHLEALLALGVIGRGDVHELLELAVLVVAQIGQHLDDAVAMHLQRQFVVLHLRPNEDLGERQPDIFS